MTTLRGDDGAEAVVGEVVGKRSHEPDHDFADGFFVAGGAGSFGKGLEQLDGGILRGRGEGRGERGKCEQAEEYGGAAEEKHDGSEK